MNEIMRNEALIDLLSAPEVLRSSRAEMVVLGVDLEEEDDLRNRESNLGAEKVVETAIGCMKETLELN
ncbi:hypothetical protein TSUD_308720 [Trifolium subterraneum]|nr:hypothetical protein TSUD_308720 [Trifolium subterraneum]